MGGGGDRPAPQERPIGSLSLHNSPAPDLRIFQEWYIGALFRMVHQAHDMQLVAVWITSNLLKNRDTWS
jgi:hypothetical protein